MNYDRGSFDSGDKAQFWCHQISQKAWLPWQKSLRFQVFQSTILSQYLRKRACQMTLTISLRLPTVSEDLLVPSAGPGAAVQHRNRQKPWHWVWVDRAEWYSWKGNSAFDMMLVFYRSRLQIVVVIGVPNSKEIENQLLHMKSTDWVVAMWMQYTWGQGPCFRAFFETHCKACLIRNHIEVSCLAAVRPSALAILIRAEITLLRLARNGVTATATSTCLQVSSPQNLLRVSCSQVTSIAL